MKHQLTLRDLRDSIQMMGMPAPNMQADNAISARVVVSESMSGSAFLKGEFVLFVPPSAVTHMKEES